VGRAALVFWNKGYQGASFRDLTEAMGIGPPSLCAAFGDKRGLFLEAVDHYAEAAEAAFAKKLDGNGELSDDLTAFFRIVVDGAAGERTPRGCLVCCVLADAAETDPVARQRLAAIIEAQDRMLRGRFARAGLGQEEAAARARLAASVAHEIALRARAGTSAPDLDSLAKDAVRLLAQP
jgi:AcrR family transcriptional regulator